MQVTVKLATREGAAHISGILAGFTLLAKRGELTLRVLDARQGSPIAREALLETEINGRTVVFDLMDGYFYNDPAAVLALFSRADVVFKRSFSAEKNRQFPGDISAKLRPLGLNYYVTCPGSPLEAERSAKSRLKQWALSTRCYPQDFEARLIRVRKKPRILFLTRLWDPEEPAVQQYPDLQTEWRQVNADRIELLHRLQSAFPAQFTGGVSDNTCARRQCPELIGAGQADRQARLPAPDAAHRDLCGFYRTARLYRLEAGRVCGGGTCYCYRAAAVHLAGRL